MLQRPYTLRFHYRRFLTHSPERSGAATDFEAKCEFVSRCLLVAGIAGKALRGTGSDLRPFKISKFSRHPAFQNFRISAFEIQQQLELLELWTIHSATLQFFNGLAENGVLKGNPAADQYRRAGVGRDLPFMSVASNSFSADFSQLYRHCVHRLRVTCTSKLSQSKFRQLLWILSTRSCSSFFNFHFSFSSHLNFVRSLRASDFVSQCCPRLSVIGRTTNL